MKKTDFAPKLSVIMPLYNMEKYIDEGFLSIVNQTIGFENIQVIFVDDGSTDKTAEICKKYCDKYPDNVMYHYKENGGISIARNTGAKFAKAKYINFFDADDKWDSAAFENMVDFMDMHFDEIDMVVAHVSYFDRKKGFKHYGDFRFIGDRIIDINKEPASIQLAVCSALIKTEIMDKLQFDPKLRFGEDQPFVSRLVTFKEKYGALGSAVHHYRKHFEGNSFQDTRRLSKIRFLEHPWLNIGELVNFSLDKYGEVHPYHKHVLMYDLSWVFVVENVLDILSSDEKEKYLKKVHELLQYIDDSIIINQKNMRLRHKVYALKQKYGKNILEDCVYENGLLYFNNIKLFDFNGRYVCLLKTSRKTTEGNTIIRCTTNISIIDKDYEIISNDKLKEFKIKYLSQKNRVKYSYDGNVIYDGGSFEISLDGIPEEGFKFYYKSKLFGKIPLAISTTGDFDKTDYLSGITVFNNSVIPSESSCPLEFPLGINGRVLDYINRNEEPDSIKEKCNKQMNFFVKSDSSDYRELNEEEISELEAFWKPYEFAYKPANWRYNKIYTNCRDEFDVRYIPEELQKYYFSSYYMDKDYIKAFDDKNYYDEILPTLNKPKTIVHKINGLLYDSHKNLIDVKKAAELCIKYRDSTEKKIGPVIKPSIRTSGGSGVIVVNKSMNKTELEHILGNFRENLIVQAFINQHPEMSKANATSVNSLRVMSFLENGKCNIVAACMRMGQNKALLDNAGLGGLSCKVDIDGSCHGPLYDKKGHVYEKHPQGFSPEGFTVPSYETLIKTIKKVHTDFPQLRLISWDFAIDKDGKPVFIEWNMKGDTQILQFSNGPLWGKQTKYILDDFFSNVGKPHIFDGVKYLELLNEVKVIGSEEGVSEIRLLNQINEKPVTEIIHRAFFNNNDVVTVEMADTIKVLGYQAFLGCRNLEEVKLPAYLETISDGCFTSCKLLEPPLMPKTLKEIKANAFSFCMNFRKLTLPGELTKVSYCVFKGCKELKEITLGENTKIIESKAFENCKNLTKINRIEALNTVHRYAFTGCNKLWLSEDEFSHIKSGYKAFPNNSAPKKTLSKNEEKKVNNLKKLYRKLFK